VLRLLGFFAVVIVLTTFLGHLPLVGPLFARTGIFGIWISAMLLGWAISAWGSRAVRTRRDRSVQRELEAVDSPRNRGKLGTLMLAQGRVARALEHLDAAVEGEPEVAEWRWRRGLARMRARRWEEAAADLASVVGQDEEYAYGQAMMRLAEVRSLLGRDEEALGALDVVARNHGPSPEEAYRRGVALKALGRRDEARASFERVHALARESARFRRREAAGWRLRALVAGWL